MALSCPFCCNEKFANHSELKYHIMSINDNLRCPSCEMRCDSLLELAEHVGTECPNIETHAADESLPERSVQTKEDETIENIQAYIEHGGTSILAQALQGHRMGNSAKNVPVKQEPDEPEEDDDEEEEQPLYNCQMCNMEFNSIEHHLEQFHKGEEVILETEEDALIEDSSELIDISANDHTVLEIENCEEKAEERQCVDKEGRVYTQKLVKIDKWWENNPKPPVVQKFTLNDGKVRKLTEDESTEDEIIEYYFCETCSNQYTTIEDYNEHQCMSADTKFKCTHCSRMFMDYKSLASHMKTHVTKDPAGEVRRTVTVGPFVCDICNTLFPSFKSLRLHKRMHEPVKTKEPEAPVEYTVDGTVESSEKVRLMFLCDICNKAYDKKYEEVHMKSHTKDQNYDCVICNRKFYTQENLDMHLNAHNSGKRYNCSYCKKGFTSDEALQEHVKNQCQKRLYECQYCGRRFSRPHEKVKHERIHTGEKPHICQLCGKGFRVSYCLTLHMRTHSGTRPYQCQHCDKRFKSHSVYNHHLLTHSDVRAYKCPFCPKAFKTGVQLAGHKNSHTKPFACTECNRPFASLYAVRVHMETHKRENNLKYDCFMCGASYARSFALKEHMKEQHNTAESHQMDGLTEDDILIELETAVSTTQIEEEMKADPS